MRNFLSKKEDLFGGTSFFDDVFVDFFAPTFLGRQVREMKTDVRESDKDYELSIDMPGFDKKDITVSLKDGYLTVKANRQEKEENKGNYLRQERSVSCSRSYFVGDGVTETDVKAKYDNGTLTLIVPKIKEKEIPSGNIEIE